MELLPKSPHCYEIIGSSQHTVSKFLSHEKTDSASKSSTKVKRMRPKTDQLYEVEPAKPDKFESPEPTIIASFTLQPIIVECWNFTTVCSTGFLTLTKLKLLKWLQAPFFKLSSKNFPRQNSSRIKIETGTNTFSRLQKIFHRKRNRRLFQRKSPQHTQSARQEKIKSLQTRS